MHSGVRVSHSFGLSEYPNVVLTAAHAVLEVPNSGHITFVIIQGYLFHECEECQGEASLATGISVRVSLRLQNHVVHYHIRGKGHDGDSKAGKEVAEHRTPGEDRVPAPSLPLRPRVAIHWGSRRRVCHMDVN